MEVAASRQESVEDMAAPAMAPIPTTNTAVGVRCRRTMGNTIADSPRSYGDGDPYDVMFQSNRRPAFIRVLTEIKVGSSNH